MFWWPIDSKFNLKSTLIIFHLNLPSKFLKNLMNFVTTSFNIINTVFSLYKISDDFFPKNIHHENKRDTIKEYKLTFLLITSIGQLYLHLPSRSVFFSSASFQVEL